MLLRCCLGYPAQTYNLTVLLQPDFAYILLQYCSLSKAGYWGLATTTLQCVVFALPALSEVASTGQVPPSVVGFNVHCYPKFQNPRRGAMICTFPLLSKESCSPARCTWQEPLVCCNCTDNRRFLLAAVEGACDTQGIQYLQALCGVCQLHHKRQNF